MKGISLDLSRMARAMGSVSQNWEALHVAGTNGKGSVCSYLSALCRSSGMDAGLFTSPYLVEPRDAIKINEVSIPQQKYDRYRRQVLEDQSRRQAQNRDEEAPGTLPPSGSWPSSLTEFELGTLVAFSAFDDANVKVGIVEVGLGGRLDSTNALQRKKVTVITKIGLDHQKLLGDTLTQIAKEKAGIMMADVPCVVDGSNPPEVLEVFEQQALGVGAPLHVTTDQEGLLDDLYRAQVMPYQAQNMACAIMAFRLAFPHLSPSVSEALPILKSATHLGRLSWLNISDSSTSSSRNAKPVLIDGAHNPQSAETLSAYVEKHIRRDEGSVTWIIAVSMQDGKDAEGMLRTLVRPGDVVLCVAFSRRPTMPWVEPVDPSLLRQTALKLGVTSLDFAETDKREGSLARGMAEAASRDGPAVLAGSLYLVGDAYRLYGDSK